MSDAVKAAREAGIDCGLNGPNTTNCHFAHFATPAQTAAWEGGKRHGSDERARRLAKRKKSQYVKV
jgi:ribosome modulation factor